MLNVKIFGIDVCFYFGFFALLAFCMLTGQSDTGGVMSALVCAMLHELGHLTAMVLTSSPPERLCFYAGGIKIIPDKTHMTSRLTETIILSAGCAVNFALAILSALVGAQELFRINLTFAIFNLAPFKYFDGGRILELYFPEKVRRVSVILLAVVVIAAVIYSKDIGIYALAVLIFVSVSEIFM